MRINNCLDIKGTVYPKFFFKNPKQVIKSKNETLENASYIFFDLIFGPYALSYKFYMCHFIDFNK